MKIGSDYIDKITTIFEDSSRGLKAYILGPIQNPIENDYYNNNLSNIFKNENSSLNENDIIEFKNGEKCVCNYFDETGYDDITLWLSDISLQESERLFLVFNINCLKDKKAIFKLGGRNLISKLWINDKIIFKGNIFLIDAEFFFINLPKGNNIIFAECSRFNKDSDEFHFSFQIKDFSNNRNTSIENQITSSFVDDYVKDKVKILENDWDYSDKSLLKFTIIPKDLVNLSEENKLFIAVKNDSGQIYDKFEAQFSLPVEYDIDKIREKYNNIDVFLCFEISYKTKFGAKYLIEHYILIKKLEYLLNDIEERFGLINNLYLSVEDRINIELRIKNLKYPEFYTQGKFVKRELDFISKHLDYLEDGLSINNLIYERGCKTIYYKSTLDGQYEKYYIRLPANYSNIKKYPLILAIPTTRYGGLIYNFDYNIPGLEAIIVEISLRGVTTGSYIGEASFMEVFKNILKIFSIDEDRIYAFGNSNGAYATWALAESHPDIFAAIATVAGAPYGKNLCNLTNMGILNIVGDKDEGFNQLYKVPTNYLSKNNENYVSCVFRDAAHNSVSFVAGCNYIIEWLLRFKREKNPKKVFFRTERIRYNKTSWFEILELEQGKKYAEVEENFIGNSISISSVNVNKLKIVLPANITSKKINISINEDDFSILNKNEDLYFEKNNAKFCLVDTKHKCQSKNTLGMGVLDVFMDSLKIVIPSQYNCVEEAAIIHKIAQSCSSPETQSWISQIFTSYPIIVDDKLDSRICRDNNLMFVGLNFNNDVIRKILPALPIKLLEKGYEYKGEYVESGYCIFFISSNPLNEEKKVAIIYANDYHLLKKNLFLRKIIIPSYFNGIHPFLNNEAILFNSTGYSIIDVFGNDIKPIVTSLN